jgi:SAM-dependent methyltransferase
MSHESSKGGLIGAIESKQQRKRSLADYKHFVRDHYDGLPGALTRVTGVVTGHEALAGRLIGPGRFDVRGCKRILDAGCGNGRYSRFLLKEADPDALLTGFDYSQQMLRRARERLHSDRVTHVAADLTRLPYADAAFDAVEARDRLAQLLRLLPPRERGVVARAYLDDQPQREIARREDLSVKAVESILYRAVRRLRTVAAQCGDAYEELALWCPHCGRHRLLARLQPGHGPDWPIHARSTCPGCGRWHSFLGLPLALYPTLEGALIDGMAGLGAEVWEFARSPAPRCAGCGAPVAPDAGSDLLDRISWTCRRCHAYGVGGLENVAAGLPAWRAFWRATPRMRVGRAVAVERGGEAQVELTAWDDASGRTATLRLARGTLDLRGLEVTG